MPGTDPVVMNQNGTTTTTSGGGIAGLSPASVGGNDQAGGRRRRGASVKTLKRMLKKNGLKTTGKKATLTRRAKKAHLKMHGGEVSGSECPPGQIKNSNNECVDSATGGRKKKSRSRSMFKLY